MFDKRDREREREKERERERVKKKWVLEALSAQHHSFPTCGW